MSPSPAEVRLQLERVLASPLFAGSGRMSRFLTFVVDKALAGESDRLKEYVIGVEVFDRDEQYDPRVDSIVRVEAARLRGKLAEYYTGEGRDDAVLLSLPKGGYAPVITLGRRAAPANGAATAPAAVETPPDPVARGPHLHRTARLRGWLLGTAVAAAAASAVVAWQPWAALPVDRLRVAVLPFTPYPDAGAETAAVALRITEGVTAELVRDGRFIVVASSAARAVYTAAARPRDIAAALDAAVLIEARVVKEGERVRVEARATGATEQKLWVDSFVGVAADSDSLERELAAAIADALSAVKVHAN